MSILDQSSKVVTKEFLMGVALPKKTKSYSPVPHKIVVETALEAFDKANIKVKGETYRSARDGRIMNGVIYLDGGDKEMNLRYEFQNSYNKSRPLAGALGSNVIVCGNGLVIGDMGAFKRKHTGSVLEEFQSSIKMYISNAGELFTEMVDHREKMKDIEMTKRTSAELIGRMFLEDNLVTATQLGIIKRELDNPSFDYGTDKNTLWDTYNAVTVSFKEAHPSFHLKSHIDLHKFVKHEFAL